MSFAKKNKHLKNLIYKILYSSTQDYVVQPIKITLNNIIKELPSTKEIILPPIIKTYSISSITNIFSPLTGISSESLRNDATHWGSFYQNLNSAGKNFIFWASGDNFGSRSYQLYHPVSDLLKGVCKISLLSAGEFYGNKYLKSPFYKHFTGPFYSNSACEFVQKYFLTGVEEITNKNLNHYSFSDWYSATFTIEFWAIVTRKAALQSAAQKIVQTFLIIPTAIFFSPKAQYILGDEWFNYLSKDHTLNLGIKDIKIPYLPSAGLWAREAITASILIPLARTSTYTINPQIKVLAEKDGLILCKEIGYIIKNSQKNQIDLEYKYDAKKTLIEEICNDNKILNTTIDKTKIIIHYLASDDFIGSWTNYVGSFWKNVHEEL